MTTVYIGLGSNLGDRLAYLQQAVRGLQQLASAQAVQVSSLYASAPMGPQDQPDYLNAVVSLDTVLSPLGLLDQLQALEQAAGRQRQRHWGERTLDVDLLHYGNLSLSHERLTLPHPGVGQRDFVDIPLLEIQDYAAFTRVLTSLPAGLVRIVGPDWWHLK